MLISFSGLPGVGKSSVARLVAQRLKAVWLRVDSLEQALLTSGVLRREALGPAGYYAAYAAALDNLRLGHIVLADCVNPLTLTRNAWQDVAVKAGSGLLEVELICSDPQIHRARVEGRASEIPGLPLPDWQAVLERNYEVWERAPLVLNTARLSILQAAEAVCDALQAGQAPFLAAQRPSRA